MKKNSFSVGLIITTTLFLSFNSLSFSNYTKDLVQLKTTIYDELVNNHFEFFEDSIFKSNQTFKCSFLSEIDEETVLKINDFIKNRKGVVSCSTDKLTKKIIVVVDSTIGSNDMHFVFNAVKIKFLSALDKPVIDEH